MYNRLLLTSMCLFALVACAPLPIAPVEERSVLTERQQIDKFGGQLIRIAQPGDTMHGIAFIAGLDVSEVAAWNGIEDTSKLQVGQRIRLTKPIGFIEGKVERKSKPKPQPKVAARRQPATTPSPAPNGSAQAPSSGVSGAAGSSKPSVSRSTSAATRAEVSLPSRPNWSWPSPGKVIRQFALAKGQQGIDIQSTKGRAVLASSAGDVVYVGSSLKGYGNLIIVKHNDTFLSAYAHNAKILVKEGQRVAHQQAIGSVGINNRREPALHFQIRKNGRPVNPLTYLPNRP